MTAERLTGQAVLCPVIIPDPSGHTHPVTIPVLLDAGKGEDRQLVDVRLSVAYLEQALEAVRHAQRVAAVERAHELGLATARAEYAHRAEREAAPVARAIMGRHGPLGGMVISAEAVTTNPANMRDVIAAGVERSLSAARARRCTSPGIRA